VEAWNPAMERITGTPASEAVGRPVDAVFRSLEAEFGESVSMTGTAPVDLPVAPVSLRVTPPNEDPRWLMCAYSALSAGGYVVVARDVTAERLVEEMKTDFLATVSHELRTPLTPIKGFLRTLAKAEDRLRPDQRREMYDVMLAQSERLERLVGDLLDATSLERQQVVLVTEEVAWDESAAGVVELFQAQAPDREFRFNVAGSIPPVLADGHRAEQVLSNLLTNAARYSPPGSPIEVTIERRGSAVATTVTDWGPGVPVTAREQVFERFRRLGNHLSRPSGGVGLGLFIARRLVEDMGGQIRVDDAAGGGAAFSFTLPVAGVGAPPCPVGQSRQYTL
jgi:signal transduction histidine kinase